MPVLMDDGLLADYASKPMIVEDAMRQRAEALVPPVELGVSADAVLAYGAWRAFRTLREEITGSDDVTTVEHVLTIVVALEAVHEALYRAAAQA